MGNKILGKRSRNFYKGFNERQLDYIKQKFSTMQKNNCLDKTLFKKAYQLNDTICSQFYNFVDFDQSSQIDEYEFICAVHTFCNMTVKQLGGLFFDMCTNSGKKNMKESDLKQFTQICLKYNAYLQKKKITDKQISSKNKDKFKKYDFDKNGSIDRQEFIKIATKDQDYKTWMFNMGFITKNQLDYQDQIYDLVDSDIDNELERHLAENNPNVDKIKRGIEHRIDDDEFQLVEEVGEQSVSPMSQKQPWQKVVEKCKIDETRKQNPNSPSQSLTISHIFGYRSFDCRGNLKFDPQGNIIYHQGAVGIIMQNQKPSANKSRKQYFMNEHKDDISCLEVNDNLILTGEVGSKPIIVLWESNGQKMRQQEKIQSKMIISKGIKDSVGNLCISADKKLIAANCDDEDHTLVIYDLEQLKEIEKDLTSTKTGIIATGNLTKYVVFDIKFTIDSKMVIVATMKELIFVSFEGGTLNGNRGQFNNFSNSPSLCLLPLEIGYKGQQKKFMLSGMANGSVYFWQDDKCVKAVVGHTGSVSALALRKDNGSFVSGDKSGKIIVWNQKLQKQFTYSVPKTSCPSNMIVSLATNKNQQVIVGTKSSDIYKMRIQGKGFSEVQTVVSGHSDGHIWALTVDQNKESRFFYTGGQDQRLIKWQYGTDNKLVMEKKCKYKIRSIDFNHLKNLLVVGYMNGIVEVFDADLKSKEQKYQKVKNPDQEALNIVKYNSQGEFIMVCYSYPKYCVKMLKTEGKALRELCEVEFKNKVIFADWGKSSKNDQQLLIRVNTQDNDYLTYEFSQSEKSIKPIQQSSQTIKTAIWTTTSCILSTQTQGFKTQGVQQSDITICERSRRLGNVILIGDKYSKIKLFNYPCKKYPIFNKYNGHSNEVTAIQFSRAEDYVISVGGQEKSIFVWKYDPMESDNAEYFQQIQEQVLKTDELQQATGQQAGATKPFLGQLFNPSDYDDKYNPRRDNKQPKEDLHIKHVFGLRNQYIKDEVRNQVKFTQDSKHVLFPTACLGVKMNIQSKKQQFYHEHKEDIVSFAVDSKRQLMATGQMAEKNAKNPRKKILSIYVWDIEQKKVLKKLDGFHTIAVVFLEFSPSGKHLFTVGNDDKNSFAVYDWKSGSILYSGPVSNGKVNGISWKSQTDFMTVGNDHVKIWTNGKGKQGKFPSKPQAMFCCLSSGSVYVTGCGKGKIYNWIGNQASKALDAHTGKVQSLCEKGDMIYSGGDDGIILGWKKAKNGQIDIKKIVYDTRSAFSHMLKHVKNINEEQYGVLSLDFSPKTDELLIATRGASIIHLQSLNNTDSSKIIHQGHYKGQLWALSTRVQSGQSYIITGGDDKSVRIWDIDTMGQVHRVYFENKIRGLDWSNGPQKNIVVADSRAKLYLYDSKMSNLYSEYTGKPYQENQGAKIDPWVEDIKFSPDSSLICYGTHAKSRYLEFVRAQGNKLRTQKSFLGGSSALLHVDWSRDSSSIAINTQAYEYMFFGLDGKQISASSMRDQPWATWTRKFGFQVKGIFQGVDYTDVNTVCRHPNQEMIAVGYDDQTIRLFKYPAYVTKQKHKTFYGHSSHVTKVRFTADSMVSVGGLDRTLIVWDIDGIEKYPKSKGLSADDGEESDGLDDLDEDVDLPNKAIIKKKKKEKIEEFYEVADEGDEFMAIKPWLGAIKEPTYEIPKQTTSPPQNISLQLEYVFGYRVKDCRQNLFFVDDQTLLFHAAAVLIYHDCKLNKQNLLTQHNDDILSIAYDKRSGRVLTGQLGPKPLVCFYENGKFLHSFKAPVTKGVIALSISPDGRRGICVGMDEDHYVAVLDLDKGHILAKEKGGKKIIMATQWVNENEFVTIGINHFRRWSYDGGKKLKYDESRKRGNFVSLDVKDDLVLTGGSKGSLTVWKGKAPTEIILKSQEDDKQELSVVECVKIMDDFVACGTKDGFVVILDRSLKQIKCIDMKPIFEDMDHEDSQNPSIRSIDFYKGNKMVVGTFGSQIYTMNINSKFQIDEDSVTNILKCHYSPNNTWTNEVWGLCMSGDYIFTCSDDATLRCWSLSEHKMLYSTSLNITEDGTQLPKDKKTKDYQECAKGRAVAVSPDQKYVVVGAKEGTVRVFEFHPNKDTKLKRFKMFKHAKQWISDIKFCYKTLIIGSHDNAIYVYDFDQDGKIKRRFRPMKKHSSYITHMDTSRDSCFLQSTCGAYQLLFWDLNTGKQLTSGASMLKDQRWSTWTCNLGWPVQGIYPKCTDGTFINAVDRSNLTVNKLNWKDDQESFSYLAAGNDSGKVCVYNYPCTIKNSKYVEGKGHSSHVTTVRWNDTDEYLTSVGGEDQCLMVWKVVKK